MIGIVTSDMEIKATPVETVAVKTVSMQIAEKCP